MAALSFAWERKPQFSLVFLYVYLYIYIFARYAYICLMVHAKEKPKGNNALNVERPNMSSNLRCKRPSRDRA